MSGIVTNDELGNHVLDILTDSVDILACNISTSNINTLSNAIKTTYHSTHFARRSVTNSRYFFEEISPTETSAVWKVYNTLDNLRLAR